MTLADVLTRMHEDACESEQHGCLGFHASYGTAMTRTPEGQALQVLVEATLAWRGDHTIPIAMAAEVDLADAIDAYREATKA